MALITLGANSGKGKVLQVVSVTKSDTFSTSSTSYVDITGLSTSITPSSTSNKILMNVSIGRAGMNNTISGGFQFVRNSTAIGIGDTSSSRGRGTFAMGHIGNGSAHGYASAMSFLDSPNTTSSTTYKCQVKAQTSTFYINRSSADADSDNASNNRYISTLTLMEIQG
jgi:hypothetical protein